MNKSFRSAEEQESQAKLDFLDKRLRRLEETLEKIESRSHTLEDKLHPVNAQIAQLRNEINGCIDYMVREIGPRLESAAAPAGDGPASSETPKQIQKQLAAMESSFRESQEKMIKEMERLAGLGAKWEGQEIKFKEFQAKAAMMAEEFKTELETRFAQISGRMKQSQDHDAARQQQKETTQNLELKVLETRVKELEQEARRFVSQGRKELYKRFEQIESRIQLIQEAAADSATHATKIEPRFSVFQKEIELLQGNFQQMKDSVFGHVETQGRALETHFDQILSQVRQRQDVEDARQKGLEGRWDQMSAKLQETAEALNSRLKQQAESSEERFKEMRLQIDSMVKESLLGFDPGIQEIKKEIIELEKDWRQTFVSWEEKMRKNEERFQNDIRQFENILEIRIQKWDGHFASLKSSLEKGIWEKFLQSGIWNEFGEKWSLGLRELDARMTKEIRKRFQKLTVLTFFQWVIGLALAAAVIGWTWLGWEQKAWPKINQKIEISTKAQFSEEMRKQIKTILKEEPPQAVRLQ